ncbi:MAG TPA: acyl transferase [Bacteroidetes bacterium]|nr:acyl transferase [Bacteroidota bacterium]
MLRQLKNFSGNGFDGLALDIFRFQAAFNETYSRYLSFLKIKTGDVKKAGEIPFLPIQFFKNFSIKTGTWQAETVFTSSGTTGNSTSRHAVRDLGFYKKNTERGFEKFYGPPSAYCVLALLPSYLERSGSSLVFMADHFIRLSKYKQSGFFLNNTGELLRVLEGLKKGKTPTLLLGVSFALLDLAERHSIDLQDLVIMETGGMKGRRKELTRNELHAKLKAAFKVKTIHSEYGMTELFSQAYSKGDGLFCPAPTMKVLAREITDPLSPQKYGRTGALNIIDLANFESISFIATDDLGQVSENGSFTVLGRLDNSDIRGCNLMVE